MSVVGRIRPGTRDNTHRHGGMCFHGSRRNNRQREALVFGEKAEPPRTRHQSQSLGLGIGILLLVKSTKYPSYPAPASFMYIINSHNTCAGKCFHRLPGDEGTQAHGAKQFCPRPHSTEQEHQTSDAGRWNTRTRVPFHHPLRQGGEVGNLPKYLGELFEASSKARCYSS